MRMRKSRMRMSVLSSEEVGEKEDEDEEEKQEEDEEEDDADDEEDHYDEEEKRGSSAVTAYLKCSNRHGDEFQGATQTPFSACDRRRRAQSGQKAAVPMSSDIHRRDDNLL